MLTATVCRQLPAKDKTYKKGDEGGLYLMVRPSGSKHWHMSYRIDGKERKLSFGRYHDDPERGVTLAEARVKRDIAKKAIGQGIDPGAVKKAAKLDPGQHLEARNQQPAPRTASGGRAHWLADRQGL